MSASLNKSQFLLPATEMQAHLESFRRVAESMNASSSYMRTMSEAALMGRTFQIESAALREFAKIGEVLRQSSAFQSTIALAQIAEKQATLFRSVYQCDLRFGKAVAKAVCDADAVRRAMEHLKRPHGIEMEAVGLYLKGMETGATEGEDVLTAVGTVEDIPPSLPPPPPRIALPIGARFRQIAEFLCSKNTMERVIEPTIADFREEHSSALLDGRPQKARWIHAKFLMVVTWTLVLNKVCAAYERIRKISSS